MTKKKTAEAENVPVLTDVKAESVQPENNPEMDAQKKAEEDALAKLPKEAREKLQKIKDKIDIFQKKIVEKFDKYIVGVALLPPEKPKEGEKPTDKINVLVLVDDSDSKKMSKLELKDKLTTIIESMAKEIDEELLVKTIILSEVWQGCYDAKYDLLQLVAMSAPIYDTGMLSAIKIAEIHKSMVIKKFEKYIVSYVLAGSLVQGRSTKTSDIDVWLVVDDTDVKKMTRVELKDKLRAIIIGMGIEAGDITGIKNKLNIQVYILTDFWDSLKEANPVIFTLLRDGVPFYDRGIFMPWKQLLKMGKIKPSAEAIDMFMSTGDSVLKRVQHKINEIGMEDTFWAILTPSQAALMLYGLAPPTPKETPELMRTIFVKKEKILEDKYVKILEKNIRVRKELEHGTIKIISGKELDELVTNAEDYLKRIRQLFEEIEKKKDEESMLHLYDTIMTLLRDVLKCEGCEKTSEDELVELFESKLVCTGKLPSALLRTLNEVVHAKKDYDSGKLTKPEVENVKRDVGALIKSLVEYLQRKRGREMDRVKIRIRYGQKFGEVVLLGNIAYIVVDIDSELKDIRKANVTDNGALINVKKSTLEEMEHDLSNVEMPPRVFIREKLFEHLKDVFGADLEILINY